jgi:two-component system chemotaxis sensor kinase CheA
MNKKDKEAGKKDFISEAEEILEELTADIQQLEASVKKNNVKPELINKIFREFHSLKGISGMLGFDKISTFTHDLENMLDKLRLGKVTLSGQTVDVLYQALDMLNRLINEVNEEEGEKIDPSGLVKKINEAMTHEPSQPQTSAFPELTLDEQTIRSFTEYEEHRLRENLRKGVNLYSIRLILDNTTFDQELREITEILANYGEIISTLPSFDTTAGPDKMVFRLIFGTGEKDDMLRKKMERDDAQILNLRKDEEAPGEAGAPVEEEPEMERALDASLKSLSHTVRVDILKLDEVMNVIGELVITKAVITNISRELNLMQSASQLGIALSRAALDLEKKLNDLQKNVIEVRLVPIGQIYNKLSRMIRKLSRETNKQIDLQFHGEDTELDKIMIEQLSDPLMHIIRNAIDHGIESGEERKQLGKSEHGLIKLSAFQRGNNVVIQVQDDGRGIQLKRVQETARKRGLIAKEHVIDIKECIELVFSPGFSSQEEVTEISGRGVGLDVVKKNIAELKGSINVLTEDGKGTVFEITLPITLAIIQALIVKTAGNKYAVPLSSVSETVRIYNKDVQTVDRREVYYLRDKTLPLIRISDVFKLPGDNRNNKLFIVVVRVGDQHMGLVVDELAGQQEIVIKSMGEKLKNIPGVAGATEIGEKKPILVLDPESMIEEVTQSKIRAI